MAQPSPTIRVFIVSDDPIYIRLLRYIAELNPENQVWVFRTGQECFDQLHLNPHLLVLDYFLPDISGREVFEKIIAYDKTIRLVILSDHAEVALAVELLKNGASDFIEKNEEAKERLRNAFEDISKKLHLQQEVEKFNDSVENKHSFDRVVIGNSEPIKKMLKLLHKAVHTNISVSLTGETGSGKEVVARLIHYNSDRQMGNFVAVNVAAIPKNLLESELFGHEKGAFTGADTRKIGQFELADQGTLFLDEIAELDISMQAKILRAIQEREIRPVGATHAIKFDTRIIVATYKDLAEEVEKGNFREDLYYRLLGLPVKIPPLRERGQDIILLMLHFLEEFVVANKMEKITVSKDAREKLLEYHYPGNVRELKAMIELAAVMCENNQIKAQDINFNSPQKVIDIVSEELTLKDYNNRIIHHYLKKYNRDVLLVAKKLGIGKSTIYRLLKEEEKVPEN